MAEEYHAASAGTTVEDIGPENTVRIRRQMRITSEFHEVLIVRRERCRTAWCGLCCAHVEWLVVDDAAQVMQVTSRSIYRCSESGTLHSSETPDGCLWICATSLLQAGPPGVLPRST